MQIEFDDIISEMPGLFLKLQKTRLLFRPDLYMVPQAGVYVLHENNKPIYVGRSNRLKQRLQEHSRPSSTHNSAPFAFNLAKEEAEKKGFNLNKSRNELETQPDFKALFSASKQRVSQMRIQTIEIENQVTQTIFEVYAALAMETPYNDFNTH